MTDLVCRNAVTTWDQGISELEANPGKIDSGFLMGVETEAGGRLGFSREPRALEWEWRQTELLLDWGVFFGCG